MLKNLISFILLSIILSSCASQNIQRSLANSDYESDERVYLDGLAPYFPLNQNHQLVTLVNRYNKATIKYKIISLGGIVVVKNKGTCKVSGSDNAFYKLPAQSSCTFGFIRAGYREAQEGELRIYKKNDGQSELIISEMVNLNTPTKTQCQTLVTNAYRAQEPETLHLHQYKLINNQHIFKSEFIKECKTMETINIEDHNKTHLFKYCINSYYPDKRQSFTNSENGQFDSGSYRDHLNELADFEPDSYCQDIED